MTRDIDELNLLSMDYEKYFGEMRLTESQKKRRIRLAERFEDEIWFILAYIATLNRFSTIDWGNIRRRFESAYLNAMSTENGIDKHLTEYATVKAAELTQNTRDGIGKEQTLSYNRARYISENEANTVVNYLEENEAITSGKTKKTWCTMLDKRVRHTHAILEGKTIEIGAVFEVGSDLMSYPKDDSLGASAGEIINCRCSLKYS